ncbi:hypothetical protein CTAYLR_010107 [Chrysophaeum taylorii]|uniref:Phosphatidic acid phosphatase type 2/haloperoxidase domain-containing protein n=1 Tax=Chrysophaeum taylorii TaxID=2483200 RepID=A0AAD7XGK0_9STRA|nr:hypothetical protein CTAYLR_010107 [Chrysophaeum taylorii]
MVEASTAVMRAMIGELERTILDNNQRSTRLSDVEEALIARKEAELRTKAERARVERELLGATKERLEEIRGEQTKVVARLEAEQAALGAKRTAMEAEIRNMEQSIATAVDDVREAEHRVASEEARLGKLSPLVAKLADVHREESCEKFGKLSPLGAKLADARREEAREKFAKLSPLAAKVEDEGAEPVVEAGDSPAFLGSASDYDPSALLDAWLAGDPDGIFDEKKTPTRVPTPAAVAHNRNDEGGTIAAQIARLREKLLADGDPKCAAALRALVEAERALDAENDAVEKKRGNHLGAVEHRGADEDRPPSSPPQQPPRQQPQYPPYDPTFIAWQQQLQYLQQQQQFQYVQQQQQQQLATMLIHRAQEERAESSRARLEDENKRLRTELDVARGRARPPEQQSQQQQQHAVEAGDEAAGLDAAQRRELAALEFEMEKLRRSEQLAGMKETLERERIEEQQKREHDYWLEAQRRRIQALRVDKALVAEERGSIDPFLPDVFQTYEAGFGIRWDFATGPSGADLEKLRIVYALSDAEGTQGKARATAWARYAVATAEGKRVGVALFGVGGAEGSATFDNVAPSRFARLVVEVQGEAKAEKKVVGWASVPVFAAGSAPPAVDDGTAVPPSGCADDDARTLAAGAWQLPVTPGIFDENAAWPPPTSPGGFRLHARIYFAAAPPATSAVDPFAVYGRYRPWGSSSTLAAAAADRPPTKGSPERVTIRVYTVELFSEDAPRDIRVAVTTKAGRRAWTSPSASLNDGVAAWSDEDNSFDVDGRATSLEFAVLSSSSDELLCSGEFSSSSDVASGEAVVVLRRDSEDVGRLGLEKTANVVSRDASASSLGSGEMSSATSNNLNKEEFREVRRQDPTEPFRRGDGVDVFVDGATGLPDNAGASRVAVKLMADGRVVGSSEHAGIAKIAGKRFAPTFDLVVELREPALDPTSTILFRVDVLDEDAPPPDATTTRPVRESQPKVLGYAALNLFCVPGDAASAPRDKHDRACLASGGFQLPIHRARPDVSEPVRSLQSRPRVLGATLFVRIRAVPPPNGEVDDVARAGGVGAYDSSRCAPSALERQLYRRRRRRRKDPGIVSGHVPRDGTEKWLADAFSAQPVTLLSHLRAAAYETDLGFSIAVDGINHVAAAGACFYKVITVVKPPGTYFGVPSIADDAQFTLAHDLDAAFDAPRFEDPPRRFAGKPQKASLAAFFEIRPLHVLKDKRAGCVVDVSTDATKFYWTALPLMYAPTRGFPEGACYVDSGSFLLPLLRGPVPPAALAASDVWACILDNVARAAADPKNKKHRAKHDDVPFDLAPNGESLLVRLIDAQLDDLHTASPPTRKEYAVDAAIAARLDTQLYSFNYNAAVPPKKATRKLVPKGISDSDVLDALNKTFAHATGIRHYLQPPIKKSGCEQDARLGLSAHLHYQRSSPLVRSAVGACSLFGDETVLFPLTVACGLLCATRGDAATVATLAEIFGDLGLLAFVEQVLKLWRRRARPSYAKQSTFYCVPGEHFSWPSGHTMRAFFVATSFVAASSWRATFGSPPLPAALALGLVACGTGLSRVAKGRHYPSDVAGGAIVGTGLAVLAALLGPRRWAVIKYPCGIAMCLEALAVIAVPSWRVRGFYIHVGIAACWCLSTRLGLGPWSHVV